MDLPLPSGLMAVKWTLSPPWSLLDENESRESRDGYGSVRRSLVKKLKRVDSFDVEAMEIAGFQEHHAKWHTARSIVQRILKFRGSLDLAHLWRSGTLEINCSKDIKIQGIIGPCTSLEKKGPVVANTVIGQENTTSWKMCGLDKSICLTVFFDISSSEKPEPSGICRG